MRGMLVKLLLYVLEALRWYPLALLVWKLSPELPEPWMLTLTMLGAGLPGLLLGRIKRFRERAWPPALLGAPVSAALAYVLLGGAAGVLAAVLCGFVGLFLAAAPRAGVARMGRGRWWLIGYLGYILVFVVGFFAKWSDALMLNGPAALIYFAATLWIFNGTMIRETSVITQDGHSSVPRGTVVKNRVFTGILAGAALLVALLEPLARAFSYLFGLIAQGIWFLMTLLDQAPPMEPEPKFIGEGEAFNLYAVNSGPLGWFEQFVPFISWTILIVVSLLVLYRLARYLSRFLPKMWSQYRSRWMQQAGLESDDYTDEEQAMRQLERIRPERVHRVRWRALTDDALRVRAAYWLVCRKLRRQGDNPNRRTPNELMRQYPAMGVDEAEWAAFIEDYNQIRYRGQPGDAQAAQRAQRIAEGYKTRRSNP